MNDSGNTVNFAAILIMVIIIVVFLLAYLIIYKWLKVYARKTVNHWDERRLMLLVNYFLEKPFQNWTRTSADIMGTVFFYVGYELPVVAIRDFVPSILNGNTNWDGRVFNVQITNTNELYKEMRILVSSNDASKNWELRTEVREKVIDFIQANYPDYFAKVRLNQNSSPPDCF